MADEHEFAIWLLSELSGRLDVGNQEMVSGRFWPQAGMLAQTHTYSASAVYA